jgi:hypothetical protein
VLAISQRTCQTAGPSVMLTCAGLVSGEHPFNCEDNLTVSRAPINVGCHTRVKVRYAPATCLDARQRRAQSHSRISPQRSRIRTATHPLAAGRGNTSSEVERALDAAAAPVQDVRVDHRRAHVGVPEQLLDGPDVVPGLQQVRRERVPERVAGGRLG